MQRIRSGLAHILSERPSRVYDLFGSSYPRRALLSYILSPFKASESQRVVHTNHLEARIWAEVLHEFGFRVDVLDFRDAEAVAEPGAYQLVAGFGRPFEQLLNIRQPGTSFVFYGTGCHPYFSNRATVARKVEFYDRYGEWPRTGGRELAETWPLQLMTSDHYVVLGNEYVAQTYRDHVLRGHIHKLPAFPLGEGSPEQRRGTILKQRTELLWFGSAGCIHKGLTGVLEALDVFPDLTLHIAGLSPAEEQLLGLERLFPNVYRRAIRHGFLTVGTAAFQRVMDVSGMVLLPSASEGGAPSVITALAHGAGLPVISKATGLDLGDASFMLETGSVGEIREAIQRILSMEPADYERMVSAAQEYVRCRYSIARYRAGLEEILSTMVNQRVH
jgi:glycosyltransferase involved in cell wall biosynthesis